LPPSPCRRVGCWRWAGPDLLLQWRSADFGKVARGAVKAFDNPDAPKFSIAGPDIRMNSPPWSPSR
jgi:hypothetical protein